MLITVMAVLSNHQAESCHFLSFALFLSFLSEKRGEGGPSYLLQPHSWSQAAGHYVSTPPPDEGDQGVRSDGNKNVEMKLDNLYDESDQSDSDIRNDV